MRHDYPSQHAHPSTRTRRSTPLLWVLVGLLSLGAARAADASPETTTSAASAVCEPLGSTFVITGELKRWHPVTLTFEGPCARENGDPNPFLDYRLNVEITTPSGQALTVPGFFAADGDAAETGATEGNRWRAVFTPSETGTHAFTASFRQGSAVAVSLDAGAGSPAAFDGASGSFTVNETDKGGSDFRGRGVLRYVGERYLRFDDGSYFIKVGADSPENFLAYSEFDNTYDLNDDGSVRDYDPHIGDWNSGDPTWNGGRGKGIIGALNYLASEGMNSVYFLTMNWEGDGQDTWPWTHPSQRDRYDVSKLAQWDIVFSHMDRLGIQLHVVTQENENVAVLDNGNLGTERKLYYRELVARFAHHHAIKWNL
ncbi:MAG: DUF5060 domain-containing protein, partial [Rhodothermales bacterium]|nr:DUF5060 domain-containing protein [Rhodothermales bacterium]